ncbi:MAG: hypothetical protein ABS904_00820 [Solibacillus isronensis]
MTEVNNLQVKVESPISEGSFTGVSSEIKQAVESGDTMGLMKKLYAEKIAKDPKASCPSCGGRPIGKKVCEICGAGKSIEKIDYFRLENEGVLEKLYIPEDFTRDTYDKNVLLQAKEHLKDNPSFVGFLEKLDRLMTFVGRGGKLESSLFISAPSGFGKEHFVYTLLCIALEKGMTVFPYIDLAEAESLITSYESGSPKDDIRQAIQFTDLEMYEADLCILKVQHSNNGHAYKTALNIIDKRARRGKSTVIVSRYNIRYFAMLDNFKEIEGIIDPNSKRPKNLKVIEFTK